MLVRLALIRPVVAAGVLFLFLIPSYFLHVNRNSNWRPKLSAWSSSPTQSGLGESPSMTPTPSNAGLMNLPDRPFDLVLDAHRLPTADSFMSHFKAVTQMKGIPMSEAKASCTWEESDNVNFQYGPDFEWVVKDRSDDELESRRNDWHWFIQSQLLPWEPYKSRFEGRGIVILAGNGRSLKRVRVILRQLKRLGSQLPVELHFWGDEMSQDAQKDISSMWPKVYFNDLSAPTNIINSKNDNFFHVNYQLKTSAVMNSRFAEVLLLDSDNIPVIDPESLFESDTYKEYGTLFWPDIARSRPNNPMWAITNTPCRMNEYEQESGQLIVDKRKFFYHLQLAAWFNNVHATYYNEFLLGDKDMFRFAWHALKTKFGFPPKWVTSVGTVGLDGIYCGHSFAQHHPNGSVAFLHGGLLKTMPKAVMKWNREKRGGIFQYYKRSLVDEKHQFIERVAIKMWGNPDMPDRPEDLPGEWCTDVWDVRQRKLDEIVPGFEKVFDEIGGYWFLEE